MTEPIKRHALFEQVADRLRRRIYEHALKPGEWIDEKALCEAFGISRTPLREALKVLSSEGLVELIPRRGSRVRSLDRTELGELFPVMAVLEGLCTREAAQRMGDADVERLQRCHDRLESRAAAGDVDGYYEENFQFHQSLLDLSGNRWLQRMAADLRKILRLARHTQLTIPGRLQESLAEHRAIMAALQRRDPLAADQAMQTHLNRQWQVLEHLDDAEVAGDTKGG